MWEKTKDTLFIVAIFNLVNLFIEKMGFNVVTANLVILIMCIGLYVTKDMKY